jgi:signal peptidase II
MDVAGPSSIFRESTRPEGSQLLRRKHLIFGLTFPVIMALDVITKRWALDELVTRGHGHELLGGLVPLTLAYNKGAAFGMRIGEDSRWFFIPVTILALVLLGVLYKQAADRDFLRISSISLVVSGAVGNLYDRVRWDRGVVDFLGPVDLGFWDFPIFNVADMAITCGAALLAISFWMEEQEERALEAAAKAGATGVGTVVGDDATPASPADDATSLDPVTDPPS